MNRPSNSEMNSENKQNRQTLRVYSNQICILNAAKTAKDDRYIEERQRQSNDGGKKSESYRIEIGKIEQHTEIIISILPENFISLF